MKPADYRPIILQTVKDSTGRFPTVEKFVDHVIGQMETYEKMLELAGSLGMLPPPVPSTESVAAPVKERSLIIDPASPEARMPQTDVSERMTDKKGLQENFTKAEVIKYYDEALPLQISVNPPGFEQPLPLFKRVQGAPGDLTFVKISYAPQGVTSDEESATFVAYTTDEKLDAQRAMAEIKGMAEAIYRPRPNKIPFPDVSMYANASLEQTIRGANSVETDAQASPQDLQDWGRSSVTPDVIARFTK